MRGTHFTAPDLFAAPFGFEMSSGETSLFVGIGSKLEELEDVEMMRVEDKLVTRVGNEELCVV